VAPRLSLFPFLAVLICTMGALVLLLLSVTRQARLQAAREAAAKDAEKQSSIAAEMEMVQWRIDQLKSSRTETAAQLADARLVLGHLEDHSRRLRAQFAELSAQAKKAAAEGLKPGNFVPPGEDELRQLEIQIAEAQKRLAESQKASADRPKTYAIVPYDGPNSTRRRPIYIECRSDAVVLQPENIVFDESDFDEPLGPGNPLAAAVRAAREQMLMERSIDPSKDGEPYPLLLVRPDGIAAYDCALAAMKSWGQDFGYELINADWQLKYPPTDPNVRRAVAQAVELARQEHVRLVAAAPSKYGKRPRAGAYRSSLAGQGGAGDEQGRGGDGDSPGFYSSKPADRYGERYADGTSGSGNGAGGSSGHGSGNSAARGGKGAFDVGGGNGGTGLGADDGGHDGSNGATDEEFAANNPYQSLSIGTGAGNGRGMVGGASGGPGSIGGSQGGSRGGPSGGGPGGAGSGDSGGNGGGLGSAAGGFASGGPNYGGAGSPGTNGSPYGGGTGGGGVGDGATGGSVAGNDAGASGSPGTANSGVPSVYSPMSGQQGAAGSGQAGGGQAAMQGSGQPGAQTTGQTAYQPNGQTADNAAVVGVTRPDGYITGQPVDGNPNAAPPQRPDPSSAVAMVPDTPLRPGEWRPTNDPPKPDPEEEKKKKKKHPYDNVEPDHNQADWALRDARRHAAAISRPLHVDCYPDRVVIAPEQSGGEPHVVICGSDAQRNADKLVAAIWELMDSWGMAGKEMYWRPVLNFYVVPGAEPQMFELSRALDGSGLVIERKQ
jgi:hypothetical protein